MAVNRTQIASTLPVTGGLSLVLTGGHKADFSASVTFAGSGDLASVTNFSPLFTNTNVVLSDNFLTVTGNGSVGANTSAISTSMAATDKFYCEFFVRVGAGLTGVGICNASQASGTSISASLNAIGYFTDGSVNINSVAVSTLLTFTTGDNIGMAVDFVHETIWFRKNGGNWNNSATAHPENNIGGIDFSSLNAGPYFVAVEVRGSDQISVAFMPGPMLLDAISATPTAAFSTRKLRSAYASACLRVRRSSDSTEQDIGFDVNGMLDTAALSSFVGAGSGFIVFWYDQSGNTRNLGRGVAAEQGTVVDTGVITTLGGNPAINFPGVTQHLLEDAGTGRTLGDYITASAYTVVGNVKLNSFSVNAGPDTVWQGAALFSDGNGNFDPQTFGTDPSVIPTWYTGHFDTTTEYKIKTTVAASTNYLLMSRLGSGVLSAYLNGGTPQTIAAGIVNGLTATVSRIGLVYDALNIDAIFSEFLIFNTAVSNADLNILGNGAISAGGNMSVYAGASWSPI